MRLSLKKSFLVLALIFTATAHAAFAASDKNLLNSLQKIRAADRQIEGLSPRQVQVRSAWETGQAIDEYALEVSKRASELVDQLAADLKDDPSRLYYALQFYRAYPNAPPALDLHWGFYQYLLAVNDPRERDALAARAFNEKWNWDKLRAEVKLANRDNKEYAFTDTPGKTGVYRIVKAKRGPYRGKLVLDLGFSNYYLPSQKLKFEEYEIVKSACRKPVFGAGTVCNLEAAAGSEKDLFTYSADIVKVIDGDTFQAMVDLGFGMTTFQMFRLWGLDAPEMNTREGRAAKKFLEAQMTQGPMIVRAMKIDKYGRFLADVWCLRKDSSPLFINQELITQGHATAQERS